MTDAIAKPRTAFEIAAKLADLQDQCVDGVITPELEAEFLDTNSLQEDKIAAYGFVVLQREERAAGLRRLAEQALEGARREDERVKDIKRYLERALTLDGTRPFERAAGSLGGSAYYYEPAHVEVDEALFEIADPETDAAFIRVVPQKEHPDKRAILAAHKAGQPVPVWASVKRNKVFVLQPPKLPKPKHDPSLLAPGEESEP